MRTTGAAGTAGVPGVAGAQGAPGAVGDAFTLVYLSDGVPYLTSFTATIIGSEVSRRLGVQVTCPAGSMPIGGFSAHIHPNWRQTQRGLVPGFDDVPPQWSMLFESQELTTPAPDFTQGYYAICLRLAN